MLCDFCNDNFSVSIKIDENGAYVSGGQFGDITLDLSPIFVMRIKRLFDGKEFVINSTEGWDRVLLTEKANEKEFVFDKPQGIEDITIFVNASVEEDGIYWTQQVVNDSDEFSVMEITYPTPKTYAEKFDLFVPQNAGFVVEDAGNKIFREQSYYPSCKICMQYFAVYGENSGIYIATEDGRAATKLFKCVCEEKSCTLTITFPAIAAGNVGNSFETYGKCNWRLFKGDWYDATQIYSKFVQHEAQWLPEIDINGRTDLAERFKKVPFWISDYIPNTESQGNNKPMNLSAGSDIYDKDYWYKAPIAIQKELGVPIAYHVYNWHEIPFNIEYPHFMPAKKEFVEHIKELQDNNIYVLPYINAVSWEMNDDEGDHSVTFKNAGCHGATQKEDGDFAIEEYPQSTKSGKVSHLVSMCGSSARWHRMMEKLSRQMESKLNIDGIYYDQISASSFIPCFNSKHNHLPGGGSYRVDGYNRMMRKINANKPAGNFNFSECNAEAYMKYFDGFLTWTWVNAGEVPAFSTIYSGYIQMLGRCTIGNKKDDFEFFKYCTAKSLLCGQQLGWCKADIIYSPKHIEFLKNAVKVRYEHTNVFNCARMLRPPVVASNLPQLVTKAGLWFLGDIVSEQVLCNGWKLRDGSKVYIFAANLSEENAEYTISFNAAEYGIENVDMPKEFKVLNDICNISGCLGKYEIKVWEINC